MKIKSISIILIIILVLQIISPIIFAFEDETSEGNNDSGNIINEEINEVQVGNKNIEELEVEIDLSSKEYTGEELKTDIIIRDGHNKLVEGIDYNVLYSNNIYPGTADVKIVGIGNYTGEIVKQFKITTCFDYVLEDNEIAITGIHVNVYGDNTIEVNMPPYIEGYPVTKIKDHAFHYSYDQQFQSANNVSKMTLPDTLKEIGRGVFLDCSHLEEIEIPDSVTKIGGVTFAGCTSLKKIKLPKNLEKIESSLCKDCSSLNMVILPENLNTIGEGAFYKCYSLKNIELPDTLKQINDSAFEYCGIKNIELPESLNYIGKRAFYGCNFEYINVPKNVITISESAFEYCRQLKKVDLQEGIENIGNSAFKMCRELSEINFPRSLKTIGERAFNTDNNLTELVLYENIENIDSYAFNGSYHLTMYGYKDSYVEQFANDNNVSFKKICYVTFKDYDDTILKEGEVLEGKSAIPPENPTRDGYKFAGWDYDYTNISEDITINAKYKKLYTVKFKDYDESIIKTEEVADGESAEEPDNPTRSGYKFIGWDKEFDNITENTEITARYKKLYKVTFKDYDGTILKEENVVEGESAIPPSSPNKDGSIFTGWNKQYQTINEDTIIEAEYRDKNVYKVIFKNYDGTVLKEDDVIELDSAIPPEEPSRDGYRFIGWDRDFSYITDNTEIIANFVKVYTVTFKDYDGRIVKTQEVTEGQSATKPSNPTRLGYTFSKWDGTYTNVHNDTDVIAIYTKSSNTFEVGKRKKTTLSISNVSYSDTYYNATWRIDDSNIAKLISQGKSAVIINSQYNVSVSANLEGISYGSTYLRLYSNTGTVLKTCVVSVVPSMDDISSCNISVKTTGSSTYTGNEIKPTVSISNSDGVSLIEGEDYIVEYLDNINAGTGIIVISGIDSYVGIVRRTFTINPKSISSITNRIDTSRKIYDGNEQTTNIELVDGEKILINETDYTAEYEGNINAGTATLTVRGMGNYTGLIRKYFTIKKAAIDFTYEANDSETTYNGNCYGIQIDNITPNGTIVKYADKNDQYILDEMPKYSEAGTYDIKFRIFVDENHTDIKDSRKLKINPKDIETIDTIEVDTTDKMYSNKTIYTTILLKDGDKLLEEGIDYTVDYIHNKNVGRTSFYIRGKGNYTGSISKSFNIIPNNISNILVKVDTNNKTYTGKNIKTSIRLTNNGYTLEEGRDYNVSYKNNKNIGTATVIITGKGNFTGSIIKTFTIIPKKVTLSSTKNVKTKAAKITWKKDTKVSGYEVYMATSKNGKYTKIKTVKSNKTVNYTKKKLKKNKKYYFMVRSYKTVNGKKIYGAYSSKKSIKIKK